MKERKGEISITDNPSQYEITEEPFESGEEEELESMIMSHPEVMPIRELNPAAHVIVPIGSQVQTEVGPLDSLFLDDTGRLYIVEFKLVQNEEARRDVIAQAVEYASRVAQWGISKLKRTAEEYTRNAYGREIKLATLINDALEGKGKEKVSESTLTTRISRNLRSPTLVIAGNRIEQTALVLSGFLNQRKFNLPIACVEFRRYRVDNARLVLSVVKAATLMSALTSGQIAIIDEEEWLELVQDEPSRTIRSKLLDWVKALQLKDNNISYDFGSKELAVYVANPSGSHFKVLFIGDGLYLDFRGFSQMGLQEADIQEFRAKIDSIIAPRNLDPKAKEYPSVRFDSLDPPDRLTRVMNEIESAITYWLKHPSK